MDENKYWVIFWGLVALVICTLIVSITTYNVTQTKTLAALVKGGADPVAVRCMGSHKDDAICAIYVSKK